LFVPPFSGFSLLVAGCWLLVACCSLLFPQTEEQSDIIIHHSMLDVRPARNAFE
jgi:hypothetical protein